MEQSAGRRSASELTEPLKFAADFQQAYARLSAIAAGVTGDPASAEDIVQEASIIAFQKVDQFVTGTNFAAWAAQIVRNCALNHRRKSGLRRTYPTDPAALLQNEIGSSSSPRVILSNGELLDDQEAFDDRVLAALQLLEPDARCCLLLRILEDLSYAEIAELLAIPEGTAMSHVHRSKATLRKVLEIPPTDEIRSEEASHG
jgi:RNA polymerase sigma-70 factor (ECF subfamily)